MRDRHRLIPKKDRVLRGGHSTRSEAGTPGKVRGGPHIGGLLPVVELEARPPVGGTKQRLNSTGQVDKQVAHEEEPEQWQTHRRSGLGGEPGGGPGQGPGGERQALLWTIHIHGEDGSHGIHRSDEDADLTDPHGEQQPPGGLPVGLPLTEDLGQPEADGDSADEGPTQQLPWPPSRTPWWLAAETFCFPSSLLY